jgi:hypothetical protein
MRNSPHLLLSGALLLIVLAGPRPALARNFQLQGQNELCGGIGFAGDITDWTPGGFKWFNDYSRKLSERTWFNAQFNVVTGGGGRDCYRDNRGIWRCDDRYHWGGYALEFAAGVKLKWRLRNVPLQFHAKFGGAFDVIIFDVHPDYNYTGVALGFRGGFGVRYFFLPTLGVGAEIIPTFGPAFINHDVGAEFYGAIDFNTGVEWRF